MIARMTPGNPARQEKTRDKNPSITLATAVLLVVASSLLPGDNRQLFSFIVSSICSNVVGAMPTP